VNAALFNPALHCRLQGLLGTVPDITYVPVDKKLFLKKLFPFF